MVSNLDSATAGVCKYTKIGNIVNVSGIITLNPTVVDTLTECRISLPIASDLASLVDLTGILVQQTAQNVGAIIRDATNDEALIYLYTTSTVNGNYNFTFTYKIL